jgi:hypothetical protein
MRVLVLTHSFADFFGSEVVALEIAHWFRARGNDVTLGANYLADPMASCAKGIALTSAPEALEFADFALIWCQHDLLAQFPIAAFDRAAGKQLPLVAFVALSPYEPYEHVDAIMARALSADIFVNSPETGRAIIDDAHGLLKPSDVLVFHNAAPAEYWGPPTPAKPPELKSVLLVSNHPPPEAIGALGRLRRAGIAARYIGADRTVRLLQPSDLAAADAVMTIGKSVTYAIAARRPVYMYDRFGGNGWLTRGNFTRNLDYNFSGRPAERRLTASEIADDVVNGYANANAEMGRLGEVMDLKLLSLDHHLSALLDRAEARAGADEPTRRFRALLKRPALRAHIETSHAKHLIMKRAYLASRTHG